MQLYPIHSKESFLKPIFTLILTPLLLLSATIDTKLYEGEDKESYYKSIQTQITQDIELQQLQRVKEAATQPLNIKSYTLSKLQEETLSLKVYSEALSFEALALHKIQESKKLAYELQSKLLFIKQEIESITLENRERLLTLQLQFAYYKLQQKRLDSRDALLKVQAQEIEDALQLGLEHLLCENERLLEESIATHKRVLAKHQQDIIALELAQESALIQESLELTKIDNELLLLQQEYQKSLLEQFSLSRARSLCLLKAQKSQEFYAAFETLKRVKESFTQPNTRALLEIELDIIKKISKKRVGKGELLFGASMQELADSLKVTKELLLSPLFVFNEKAITLLSILKAIAILALGFLFGALYKRWILKLMQRWQNISMMSARLLSNVGYYLIVSLFIIIFFSTLGIDLSSLSLIAGALSLGIGFGLQNIVSNLLSGVILMFERSIRIGDIIEINSNLTGVVTDMRIRSTTIKTFDNIDIIVPNSTFIQSSVTNLTLEDRIRRLHIPFSVAYGTEVQDVKEAILGALVESPLLYLRNHPEKRADIRMTLMNSSSVDFELIVWVNPDMKLGNMSIQSDFLILIYNTLRAHKIEIPFPQLDLHIQERIAALHTKREK